MRNLARRPGAIGAIFGLLIKSSLRAQQVHHRIASSEYNKKYTAALVRLARREARQGKTVKVPDTG